ncbi:MAG: hypothetical protein IPO41_04545 [Acidobacteria bacterium]|nr:hypothetical protein [Acidobacteriota bacterium]
MSICVYLWIILFSSCTTKPSDLRTLVPAETLVYLETNDLAAALQPIVDSKPFSSVVTKKPDFSALKGVQVAVAVTGFETSEVAVTDEQSVGKVQPRFVAVADTHAWNYQAVAFAEKKLGSFVTEIYDSEPKLEKLDAKGGKYFTWTSQDGRKAFALVIDSLIYFGNDESAIDKALSVRGGQADSIAKTGKLPQHVPGNLASGYVSTDGVAQIAALAGLHFASQASDEEEVQSAVAGILPQLIRGTVTDVSWSTSQTSEGIEDKWSVRMPADVADVFAETMSPADDFDTGLLDYVPENATSVTAYNFKNPQVAWRSVVLTSQKKVDPLIGRVLGELSGLLFEPYGIRDSEEFLSSIGPGIVTARRDEQDEKSVIITTLKEKGGYPGGFDTGRLTPAIGLSPNGDQFYGTNPKDDEPFSFGVLTNGKLLIGNSLYNLTLPDRPKHSATDRLSRSLKANRSPLNTFGLDNDAGLRLISLLAREGHGDTQVVSTYLTETRFTKTGMERRTVSDLGFIGWMMAELAAE